MMKISKANKLIVILISILSICLSIDNLGNNNIVAFMISISIIPIMIIPLILQKHLYIEPKIISIYLIFIIMSQFFGSMLRFYELIPYYDKVMHLLSGIICAVFALIILVKLKKYDSHNLLFNIIFIISITFTLATLWEFFEYFSDMILNGDAQNVLTTGINDTMQDMIAAFFGSIIFSLIYAHNVVFKKKYINKLIEEV